MCTLEPILEINIIKSSKPIKIGLCMQTSLSSHLHGLNLNAQYSQTWHLWRQDWSSASTVNRTTVTDPTIRQPGFVRLPCHTWSLLNRTVSRQVKAHVMQTCTNGVSPRHFPVIVASDRPWTIVDTCPLTKFEGGLNLLHKTDNDAVIWLESAGPYKHHAPAAPASVRTMHRPYRPHQP